jgi:outer membrane autotransporter protein
MTFSTQHVRRARLSMAVGLALMTPVSALVAGTLVGQPHTVNPGDTAEAWTLSQAAELTLVPGASTLAINAAQSSVIIDGGAVGDTGTALRLRNGSTASISGGSSIVSTGGVGLQALNTTVEAGAGQAPIVNVADSSIVGATFGVRLAGSTRLTTTASSITATGATGIGLNMSAADLRITGKSTVSGSLHGIRVSRDDRGESLLPTLRRILIEDSQVVGNTGTGILIDTPQTSSQPDTDVDIEIRNGSVVSGGSGIAIDAAARTSTDILVDNSRIDGDIRSVGPMEVTFANAASLNGAMNGNIVASVGSGSSWNITGDSNVNSLALDAGSLAFQPTTDGTHHAATVRGDLSGSGGTIGMHATMNEGGALSSQATDRLLVEGNVTTTGPIQIVVTPTGAGALTDVNQDGIVESSEGISLVQVAGSSRADAFALRGGYVAAGPWQYELKAFGPGEADQAQNALATGALNWDYRLGNRYVCQTDCDPVDPPVDPGSPGNPDPGNPDPGNPDDPVNPVLPPQNGRVAVVPQLPSYLSAPAALLTYGDMMSDGLHQRLGDLRGGVSNDPVGGEVFARYLGGQLRYSSNLSFQRYGYDFDQQINALQLGGSLIALDGDNGSLRAGWAADHGTTRVTPKAADGNSSAKYRANGMSGWITWQHGSGLWVDGVVGSTRYRGDVGTDLRGADVGRVRASGWTMSVETGMPFALGNEWTVEPRFQLKHQSLNFRDFTDGDGLDVKLGTAKQTSATFGGRISRTANPVFMPYASLDLTHTSNGDPNADVSNADWDVAERFGSGRVGNSYRAAAGAVSQLSENVQVYGEGTYRHFVGSYGMQGWSGNVGIRVTF